MRQSASITYNWGMLKLLRLVTGGYKTGYRSLYIYTIKIIGIIIFIGLVIELDDGKIETGKP